MHKVQLTSSWKEWWVARLCVGDWVRRGGEGQAGFIKRGILNFHPLAVTHPQHHPN